MSASQIGARLVEHCRNQTEAQGLDTLYAPDAVSVEAVDSGGMGRETHGVEGIRGKHQWWADNFEVHDFAVSDAMPHGDDRFAVIFEMDVTHKASGERRQMKEVGLYHVADGRIVKEEFFYPTN